MPKETRDVNIQVGNTVQQTNKPARLDWRSLWSSVRKKKYNVTLRNNRIKNGLRWGLDQMSSSRDFFYLFPPPLLSCLSPQRVFSDQITWMSNMKSTRRGGPLRRQLPRCSPCSNGSDLCPFPRNPIWLSLGTKHKQTNPKGRRKRRREWLRTQGHPPNISKAELPLAVHPTTKPIA